jgi:hypothetical protein
LINMVAYNITILVWIGYVAFPSRAAEPATHLLRTQRWEEGLNAIQHPHAPDSLIPMFESMVDRALSRTDTDLVGNQLTRSRSSSAENPRPGSQGEYPPLPQRVGSKG